ncbi:hypothetical protein M7963_23450 [Enterobacter roggenkampii]|uniref:hypothetical protein n=1 Tax=Enterobacter roggenkampii TaxID=1812935 RepID=UPI002236FB1C|nr:hypothetical protein [Enterobacter roggenkampii]MCW5004443.1 hypothetical protein [Enterobacter roggenkampii]
MVDMVYQCGESKNFPDLSADSLFVHDITNTGDTSLRFVTVEFASVSVAGNDQRPAAEKHEREPHLPHSRRLG